MKLTKVGLLAQEACSLVQGRNPPFMTLLEAMLGVDSEMPGLYSAAKILLGQASQDNAGIPTLVFIGRGTIRLPNPHCPHL